jgi:hypothetical protein
MIFGGDGQGAGFLLLTCPNLQGPFSGLLPDAEGKEFARQAARFFLFISLALAIDSLILRRG